ncbi:MAG: TetR/AcrR family transcriptional regulator [Planctomycetes bacterium]|nr:TetR/AcrR family transcriptional regulator [Planctomycetota bacterium]
MRSGKRESKKALLKTKILSAAREVFLSEGVEDATISEIAERAGVGVGTAYNYFGSKEDLFLLAMAQELEVATLGNTHAEDDDRDPAVVITTMIASVLKRLSVFGKGMWRITMAALFRSMKSDGRITRMILQSDRRVMDLVGERLEKMKGTGQLPATFPVTTAVELIYGSVMLNVATYIYEDEATYDDAMQRIEAGVHFIMESAAAESGASR